MIILGLTSFLLGFFLGRGFRVLMLFPATLAVALAGTIEAYFKAAGLFTVLAMICCPIVFLQLGYIIGLMTISR